MIASRVMVYALVGCAIYLGVLFATVPASWVSRAVEGFSDNRLVLRAPAGSLWDGSGQLYVRPRSGPLLDLGMLRWNILWSGILRAGLWSEVTLGKAPKPMQVQVSFAGTTIRGLDLVVPAAIVSGLAPNLEALGPEGTLHLRSDDLRIDGKLFFGLAELEWRQFRLARVPELDAGSHVVRMRGGGSKVNIELGSLSGPLRLSGGGTWTRDAGLQLSGVAEHDPQLAADLGTLLKGVCAEYRDNRCRFQVKP